MSKLRKQFITVLAVLFCALLILSTALMIPKSKTANARRDTDNWTTIGTSATDGIDKSGNFPFDKDKLSALYTALTGKNNYTALKSYLAGKDGGKMTSADFRTQQGGTKNVSVWLGGIKWDVVYMTTVRTDDTYNTAESIKSDIIVTLWQSADDELSKATVQWSDTKNTSTSVAAPSNMYSASLIRNVTLNAGGYLATNNVFASQPQQQDSNNKYAKFTMSGVSGSFVKYLVQPKDVEYQEDEASINGHDTLGYNVNTSNNCPNEAYGIPVYNDWTSGLNYGSNNGGSNKAHYNDWADDYVWLPSLCETGGGNNGGSVASANVVNGIWMTNQNLRSTYYQSDSSTDKQSESWLRSSSHNSAGRAAHLTAAGEPNSTVTSESRAVRPALHFNLTAAARAAGGLSFDDVELNEEIDDGGTFTIGETNHIFTHEYDGNMAQVTLNEYKINPNSLTVTGDSAVWGADGVFKAALPNEDGTDKTYKITATPKTNYYWFDTGDSTARTYQINVKAAKMQVNFANPYPVTTGEDILQGEDKITSAVDSLQSGFKTKEIKNIVLTYDDYLKSPATPADTDSRWKNSDQVEISKAEDTDYWVWYLITANYHTTEKGGYKVEVSNEKVTVSVKTDVIGDGSAEYGSDEAGLLTNIDELKEAFKNAVTMTSESTSGPFTDLTNVDVIPFKLENGVKKDCKPNGYGFYDVGVYYFYLKGNSSIKFTFDTDGEEKYPSFEITPKTIAVSVVKGGTDATHAYGNDPASLLYKYDEEDLAEYKYATEQGKNLNYDEVVTILGLGRFKTIEGTVLSKLTPVGSYKITGEVGNSNYTVSIDTLNYTVTACKIVWRVADETVEYGTDLTSYLFDDMSIEEGKRANGESISELTKNAVYYILDGNGIRMELSNCDSLAIGEYRLMAELSYPNYDFSEVREGKLTVTKANYDMSGVKLGNAGFIYDGNPHAAQISGTLPDGVSVTYVYYLNGELFDGIPTEIGLYTVYAVFTHEDDNYKDIDTKAAYLKIAATQEELDQGFPSEPPEAGGVVNPNPKPSEDLEQKKEQAKKDLEDAAQKKKDEIDANTDLTDEEKQAAKDEVDEELQKGKDAIDSANSASGIDQATSDAKKNIEDISAESGENPFPWWIIAVIAGALLLIILLIIVIVKRRNSDDDDYDDFYDDEYEYDEEDEIDGDDYGEAFL